MKCSFIPRAVASDLKNLETNLEPQSEVMCDGDGSDKSKIGKLGVSFY